jgi:hypothetical protein
MSVRYAMMRAMLLNDLQKQIGVNLRQSRPILNGRLKNSGAKRIRVGD